MRAVFDTNCLISALALAPPGVARETFDFVLDHGLVVLSPYILDEFRRKCAERLQLSTAAIQTCLSFLKTHEDRISILSPSGISGIPAGVALRDVKDRPILELALFSGADALITRDKDLLVLKDRFKPKPRILRPEDFWQMKPSPSP